MSKRGRSHRGERKTKKKPREDGDSLHKDKVQRKRDARTRRHLLIGRVARRAGYAARRSKFGISVCLMPVGGFLSIRRYHAVPSGLCDIVIGRNGKPKARNITQWNDVAERDLQLLDRRDTWEPVVPKSPLEWLAEAAE